MTGVNNSEVISFLFESKNAEKVSKDMNMIGTSMQKMTNKTLTMTDTVDKSFDKVSKSGTSMNSAVSKSTKNMKKSIENTSRSAREMRGVMLGLGLSTMFMGMQMQRWGSQALRGIFGVFDNFDEGSSKMHENVTGLRASFEFLKFAIANSLEGTIIDTFMVRLTEMTAGFGDFFAERPDLSAQLIGFFATLFGAGAILAVTGQFALFTNAIDAMWGKWAGAKVFTGVIGVKLTFDAIFDFVDIFKDDDTDFISRLVSSLNATAAGALIGFTIGGPAGALIGAKIGLGISIVVNIIDWIMDEDPIGDIMEALGTAGKKINQAIFKTEDVGGFSLTPFDGVADTLADTFVPRVDAASDSVSLLSDGIAYGANSNVNAMTDASETIDLTLIPSMQRFMSQQGLNITETEKFNATVDRSIRTTYSTHIHTIKVRTVKADD